VSYQTIELSIDEGIGRLWLNRPSIRNAMNEVLIAEVTAAVSALAADQRVRIVVLGGRGAAFCAGGDLNWMKRTAGCSDAQNKASAMELATMLQALHALPKPTIARVHGAAFAGGMGLASACDIIVAEKAAEFCLTEVRIGLVPATISPYVVQALGAHAARRYMLTAERISAAEAHRIGFVHELCDQGTIDQAVASIARSLIAAGPAALARTKRLLDEVVGRRIEPGLIEMTAQVIAEVRASAEGREGVGSFLEKRKPAWTRS
jgi:methylglutaconyl-CoA hydratase